MPRRIPLLVLISAPSGGGKTTLCRHLLEAHPEMTRAVTCTTRAPRAGEQHGVDYHFFTSEEFQRRIEADEFLEYANVFGNRYGTLKSEVLDRLRAGKDVLLNIDVQGAEAVRAKAREVPEIEAALVTVFLTPASPGELTARLTNRGTEPPEALSKRLGAASREVARWPEFQYLLISDTMEEDQRRMEVILESERLRVPRSHLPGWASAIAN